MNFSTKLKSWFKKDWNETKTLFRCLPALPFAVLCAALIAMNILANKTIVNETWIALDAGICVSWISFLAGDMLVKRFGPKAAFKVSIAAILVQLMAVGLLAVGGALPWGTNADPITGFDGLFCSAGLIWPLSAGTVAFIIAMLVDTFLNWAIFSRMRDKKSFKSYAVASYVSTAVGQFVDNFVFGLLFTYAAGYVEFTSLFLFAGVGALVELLCQIFLSPIGYKIADSWRKNKVGQAYVELVPEAQLANEDETAHTHPHSSMGA